MFIRLLRLPAEERASYDLSSHEIAIHAAAPCPVAVKQQMLDWWGPIIYEYYAGSEANGSTHVGPEEWLKYPGTLGKAMAGTLHICDEDGAELPPGAFASDMNVKARDQPEIFEDYVPAGRIGQPEDIRGTVVYMAFRAGDYLVGVNLTLDGGGVYAK